MGDQLQDQVADEPGSISAALSPVQLAAIMGSASLSQSETASNRIWGAVGLAGGVTAAGLAVFQYCRLARGVSAHHHLPR